MTKAIFFIRKLWKTKTNWTRDEDRLLIEKGQQCKSKQDWKNLSILFKNKDYYLILKRFSTLNPKIKKGKWDREEDSRLKQYVQLHGKNWHLISKIFPSRTTKQIKNRYENNLNPLLKKEKFSREEDDLIKKLFDLFGNKWSKYLNYFPSRSTKTIKNRFLKINYLLEKQNKI